MDELKNKEDEKKIVEEPKEEPKENSEKNKVKLGTIGNFVLAFFVIIIISTGALTYYLIHTAKNDYDMQYNEIISNLPENTNQVEEDENVVPISNIIDSAISDVTNQNTSSNAATEATDTRKILNEELVVLYDGLILDTTKMNEVTLKYIDNTNDNADKYVITYYNYENYSFKDSKLGTLSTQVYDGLVKIDNVGKVAISEDYDAIPRNVKVVNSVPTIVSDNNPKIADYDTVKTLIADLDGNGTDEYILVMANKTTGFSKISFIDGKGQKVADLASIEKSKWKKDSTSEYYLSISNIELIDVDNDGIMEIVVEIPHATGDPTVSLLKFNNGKLDGKTNIECSLLGE